MSNCDLWIGDSIEVLSKVPSASFDAFVTDPPYTAAGGSTNGRSSGADDQFFEFWLRAVFMELQRVTKPDGCGFIFCDWRTIGVLARAFRPKGERQTAQAWTVSQALVWDRESIGLGSPFRNSYEMIAFARGPGFVSALPKNLPTVLRHRWPYGAHEHHGAEKPVELCRQLVRWALPTGGRLLDPFFGSGSVGVAGLGLPDIFVVGIEQNEETAQVARRRIAGPLFTETPA